MFVKALHLACNLLLSFSPVVIQSFFWSMSFRHLKWRPFNKFRAVSKFFDNGQNLYCFSDIFKQGQGIAKYILIPGLMFDNYIYRFKP